MSPTERSKFHPPPSPDARKPPLPQGSAGFKRSSTRPESLELLGGLGRSGAAGAAALLLTSAGSEAEGGNSENESEGTDHDCDRDWESEKWGMLWKAIPEMNEARRKPVRPVNKPLGLTCRCACPCQLGEAWKLAWKRRKPWRKQQQRERGGTIS